MSGLSGIAAVLAAVGLSADSKDSVSRASFDSAITAALAEGEKAGVIKVGTDAAKIAADATTAAHTRAKAILGSTEAKGREELALGFAFDSDMSAESAVAMLARAPKAAEGNKSRLDGQVPDPKVTSGEGQGGQASDLSGAVDRLVELRAKRLA